VYASGKAAEHGLRNSDLDALQGTVNEIVLLRDELEASESIIWEPLG
jgi:hypothetical protein